MKFLAKVFAVVAACAALATGAFAQSTVVPIEKEGAPTLTVEAPLPGPLAKNVVYIPYRVEKIGRAHV